MFILLESILLAAAIVRPNPGPLPLICQTMGIKQVAAPMQQVAVCARFKSAIERRIGKRVRLISIVPAGAREWVRVDVRFSRPATATATLSQMHRGKVTRHSEQSLSVSDQGLTVSNLDQLARDIAARIKLQ